MTIRDCNTCRYRDVDPKDDPCFSCQSVDVHRYRNWEQYRYRNWEQYREPIMRPAGQAPYYIKVAAGVAGSIGSGGSASVEPVCMSIVWDGPILPKVGTQLTITAINRNFVTVKECRSDEFGMLSMRSLKGEDRSMSYNRLTDEYTVQDVRYAGFMFGSLGFKSGVGQKFELVRGGSNDVVYVKAIKPATLAEWQKKQLVKDTLSEWRGGTTEDNMLVLIDNVLDAIGRRDNAA